MCQTRPSPSQPIPAPQEFRDALTELVQIGLRVARLVGRTADSETALADAAAQAGVEDGVSPLAASLAEAIEADRAAAAAAETRQTVVARTQAVAAAFAQASRAIRLTVMLAERFDRGWARGNPTDDHPAPAPRQTTHQAPDPIEREAERERAAALTSLRPERLERLDTEAGIGNRPAQHIINEIYRALGLDPAHTTQHPPPRTAISLVEWPKAAPHGSNGQEARPLRHQPDG